LAGQKHCLDGTDSAREQGAVARGRVDFSAELVGAKFNELDLTFSAHEEAIWCYMRPNGPPSFTPTLLHELISMRRLLQRLFAGLRPIDWRDIASTYNKKLPINCARVLVLRGFAHVHSEISVVLTRVALKSA
jgi:hypothetical protein